MAIKGTVLCTGGAGFIGSHTVVELFAAGYDVVIVDNLNNASPDSMRRIAAVAGREPTFYKVDLLDRPALTEIFEKHTIVGVIHFAGHKAVGESTAKPLMYYHNNIEGTVSLLEVMTAFNVKNLVFSSSATVYGTATEMPLCEKESPTGALNPYGRTKLFIEYILSDVQAADPAWNIISLRYFNPVGAHPSGQIGEDPKGIPNNLMPFVSQVAVGRREFLSVYGNDYPTPDGTGVRDYIHVVDLAVAHVKAVGHLSKNPGYEVFNIGTGRGTSVIELVKAYSKACGKEIPYKIVDRRAGDTAVMYADCTRANAELGWSAKYALDKMCEDAWNFQSKNPNGYTSS